MQHFLGDGVSGGGTGGNLGGERSGVAQERVGRTDAIEESPALGFGGVHGAPGIKKLGSAAVADDSWKDGAGAHVATGEADPHEQERDLRARGTKADVGG